MVSHRLQHLPSLCQNVGVFDHAQLVEFGVPQVLLQDPKSRFYALFAAMVGCQS